MTLLDYMRSLGLDDEAMATLVGGCTASAVKKWKYRERAPRLPELVRIEAVTGGAVKPCDFLPPPSTSHEGEAA